MACECFVCSLLVEGRTTKSGTGEGNGKAQSCAPQDDGLEHPEYVNTKITEEYSEGYTRVIDYSTDISVDGGSSCPVPTVEWTPPLPPGTDPGTLDTTTPSDPLYLSDLRARARSELTWHNWGTAPDFAQGATKFETGYRAYWLTFGEYASVLFQSINNLESLFLLPGNAWDLSNSESTGSQMNATVQKQQVRLTLGPPFLPMKVEWDIVNLETGDPISSDSVLLNSDSREHMIDVFPEENSDTTQSIVAFKNVHIFPCPYHLHA